MSMAVGSLILVGILAIAYAVDKIPAAVVAIMAAMICALLHMISYADAFSGLAGSAAVLLMSMMVVGGALFHTGLAARIATAFLRFTGTSEKGVMIAVMLVAALLSAVLNNVGVVVTLMPIVLKMCKDAKIPISRGLMPLSYGAAVGGIITLIGAASTVTADGLLVASGVEPVGFFELGLVGIPLTILSVIYMATIGEKLIPVTPATFDGLDIYDESKVKNDSKRQLICCLVFVGLLICMAHPPFKMPLYFISSLGALILVLTGCISEKEAYKSIDWPTIVICGAMIAVGKAVSATGGSKLIAQWVVDTLGAHPSPYFVTFLVLVVVTIMTQFLSNVSTAALMTPIAVAIASGIGVNPKTLGIVIIIAANASFLTPVGAQAFTVIYPIGKYKFLDFFKVGFPLVVINTILAVLLVPMIWPF